MKGLKFTDVSFFLAKKNSKIPIYYKLHKFIELEILNESIDNILIQFQLSTLIKKKNNYTKRYFSIINAFNKKLYKSYDLILPKNIELINKNLPLFTLLSSKFQLKCIAEIKVWISLVNYKLLFL